MSRSVGKLIADRTYSARALSIGGPFPTMIKYVVRYGSMRALGAYGWRGDSFSRGTRVVVRTNRGVETGEVLCVANEQTARSLKDSGGGHILRSMTADDENELSRMATMREKEFGTCRKCIAESGLDMQLVDIEHLFGGERIIVYYLSEGRVDFRELVKQLASEFQTRIEMRQIGVRDEAKLLADYGDCGKPVCCNTHLSQMPPVSMKMAKLQKATLDPNKISGRCGRLKCCLRYEYDTYEQLQKELPRIGAQVKTPDGVGRILAHEILTSQVLVSTEDKRRILMDARDVSVIPKSQPTDKPQSSQEVAPEDA